MINTMATVTKVQWLAEEAQEADVTIQCYKYNILCFSMPCSWKIGDTINEMLYCMNDMMSVTKSEEREYDIIEMGGYSYVLTGKVVCLKRPVLQIYDLEFKFNWLPGDIVIGDYVSVVCNRIDL